MLPSQGQWENVSEKAPEAAQAPRQLLGDMSSVPTGGIARADAVVLACSFTLWPLGKE